MTAHANTARKLAQQSKAGATRPAGNPSHDATATRLSAKAHGGGRRGTDPSSSPHRPSAASRRAYANRAILPARRLLKPAKIAVKAVRDRQANRSPSSHMVHVHAKTTLTVISPRFDPAPVRTMARTGLGPSKYNRKAQLPRRTKSYVMHPRGGVNCGYGVNPFHPVHASQICHTWMAFPTSAGLKCASQRVPLTPSRIYGGARLTIRAGRSATSAVANSRTPGQRPAE